MARHKLKTKTPCYDFAMEDELYFLQSKTIFKIYINFIILTENPLRQTHQ